MEVEDALEAETLVDLALELGVRATQTDGLERAREARAQLAEVDRFREVVGGALAHGVDGGAHGFVPGHEQDGGIRLQPDGLLQELDAGAVGHHQIGQHRVEGLLRELRDACLAGVRDRHAISVHLERIGERLGVRLVVIDDQDAFGLVLRCVHEVFSSDPAALWISTSSGRNIELVPRLGSRSR